jgi:hypothetical protein
MGGQDERARIPTIRIRSGWTGNDDTRRDISSIGSIGTDVGKNTGYRDVTLLGDEFFQIRATFEACLDEIHVAKADRHSSQDGRQGLSQHDHKCQDQNGKNEALEQRRGKKANEEGILTL